MAMLLKWENTRSPNEQTWVSDEIRTMGLMPLNTQLAAFYHRMFVAEEAFHNQQLLEAANFFQQQTNLAIASGVDIETTQLRILSITNFYQQILQALQQYRQNQIEKIIRWHKDACAIMNCRGAIFYESHA